MCPTAFTLFFQVVHKKNSSNQLCAVAINVFIWTKKFQENVFLVCIINEIFFSDDASSSLAQMKKVHSSEEKFNERYYTIRKFNYHSLLL